MDNFLNIPESSKVYGADLLINQQIKKKDKKLQDKSSTDTNTNTSQQLNISQKSVNFLEKMAQPPCDITVPREYSFDVNIRLQV